MKIELAQLITLIVHGNSFFFSAEKSDNVLFPSYSTFSSVSDISFLKDKRSGGASGKYQTIAKNVPAWYSHLKADGVKFLKLDLLNLQNLSAPYATSVLTAGNAWVIQTDKDTCWQATWSLQKELHSRPGIWKVEYLERDNLSVINDPLDVEAAYLDLSGSLLEARAFSESWQLGWENWFEEAVRTMQSHSPDLPYYQDLLPARIENIRIRQLLAGALKAWVFGGLGSWNDLYISDSSLEKEYQRISKRLHLAVIQAIIVATNITANDRITSVPLPS